ncbi:cytochrome c biogenesis protein CcdC [Bacillus sp. FJAT-49736]|uniref:CcdC family protein n=1 Tax=Bacillus sp. FJAT-49736 TaxID=2833582 RepID=UPI001BC9B2D0|nr:cytochrome c biogenesis protein CcdC [Bacillus sp. FJAT-49736]MBS4172630.1 cytochrome c biogenesis protein CcdC [Bacillus sp. FJAT-49736]
MTEIIVSSIIALCMGAMVIFIRLKASNKPVSVKKIILPPIFMSTGFLMFVVPYFRLSFGEVAEAVVVGMVFSTLLIKTSRFEVRENDIFLKRSKAFPFILIGLLVIRIVMKVVLSSEIDLGQLSGMFFLLAFGMILPWRIAMYLQYRKLASGMDENIQTKGV